MKRSFVFFLLASTPAPALAQALAPEAESAQPPVGADTPPADPAPETPVAAEAGAPSAPPPAPAPAPTPPQSAPVGMPAPAMTYGVVSAAPPSPPPTGPVTQHWQASLNLDTVFHTDPSFDVLSENDVSAVRGVSLSYAFWLSSELSIAAELGYAGEGNSSENLLGGALNRAELTSNGGFVGASARYELWGFLAPHVRLTGGMARTKFELDTSTGENFESADWLPVATLGAGVTVTTPDRFFETRSGRLTSFALGLTAEGGYRASSPLSVTLNEGDNGGRIPIEQPVLGDLSRSGPFVRVALVGRL